MDMLNNPWVFVFLVMWVTSAIAAIGTKDGGCMGIALLGSILEGLLKLMLR